MISTTLSALALLVAPATNPLPFQAAPGTPIDIKSEVDLSLRWLRGQQDPETGGYGDVRDTLLVLEAFTDSPRAYVHSDGPFIARAVEFVVAAQRADGAITNAGAERGAAEFDTRLALRILGRLAVHADAQERAKTFAPEPMLLFHAALAVPFRELEKAGNASVESVHATLRPWLNRRTDEGFWKDPTGEGGPVQATAQALFRFNAAAHFLSTLRAPDSSDVLRSTAPLPSFEKGDRDLARKALVRGAEYLVRSAIEPGRWGFDGHADPGISAMVAGALLTLPEPRPTQVQEMADAALTWLVSLQHEDGSIHAGQLANYVTSASIMALARAGRPEHKPSILRARKFLQILQADEGEGYASSDRFYGGVGYGGDERPDLSNMNMALEALSDAGIHDGDPTFTKALTFLQRCQNRSESNDLVLASSGTTIISGNDGGAAYAPGDSKAGYIELRDGRKVPRSYGSMTYALLKGYLFAGLPKEDPRVEAAWKWISSNYTLDVNPGFEASSDPSAAYQGLFYYFTTMSKALDLYEEEVIHDAQGTPHAWRAELVGRVLSLQRQDGSWVNANAPRWFEGNPVLASAYAMSTLGHALADKPE